MQNQILSSLLDSESNIASQSENKIQPDWKSSHSTASVTDQMRKFYVAQAEKLKSNIDNHAAEVKQRQDKMRLINEIIYEINNLTDEKNSLDISQNSDLLEKLDILRSLGVSIKEGKTSFNSLERDRFIENLHLAGDNWDKDNRHQLQKMEIVIKELDRHMMILKDIERKEKQSKDKITGAIQ